MDGATQKLTDLHAAVVRHEEQLFNFGAIDWSKIFNIINVVQQLIAEIAALKSHNTDLSNRLGSLEKSLGVKAVTK